MPTDDDFPHILFQKDNKVRLTYHGIEYTYENIREATEALENLNWNKEQGELAEIATVANIYNLFTLGTWAFNLSGDNTVTFSPTVSISFKDECEFAKFIRDHQPSRHTYTSSQLRCLTRAVGSTPLTSTPRTVIFGTVAAMCQSKEATFSIRNGFMVCTLPVEDSLLDSILDERP